MTDLLIPLAGGLFDWVNDIAASTKTTAKVVGAALVVLYIVFHAIVSKFSIAKIIVAGLAGAILIALIVGGVDVVANMFTTELS